MKVAVFSTKPYDQQFLEAANQDHQHEFVFLEPHLNHQTYPLSQDCPAVCVFVNDQLNKKVLTDLANQGTKLIALRCAGFNNVDLEAAQELDLTVVRVPAYSPHAVAEHTIGLILALNRKIYRAYNRVREGNFALDGLLGFDLNGRVIGIIGTGKIGFLVAKILTGFGCHIVANDPYPNPDFETIGANYVSRPDLFAQADIISLHCPLMPETHHLINQATIDQMKSGVMLINTSRGGLIDTAAVIEGLKAGQIGSLGLDVYEEEGDLFFEDLSQNVIQDDLFARLLMFPNVVVTGHQAFFTQNALEQIAKTTLENITLFEQGQPSPNEISLNRLRGKN